MHTSRHLCARIIPALQREDVPCWCMENLSRLLEIVIFTLTLLLWRSTPGVKVMFFKSPLKFSIRNAKVQRWYAEPQRLRGPRDWFSVCFCDSAGVISYLEFVSFEHHGRYGTSHGLKDHHFPYKMPRFYNKFKIEFRLLHGSLHSSMRAKFQG